MTPREAWDAAIEAAAKKVLAVQDWDGSAYYCDACKGGAIYPDSEDVATRIRSLTPPAEIEAKHPDDAVVDRFAAAMKDKLARKRAEGRGGWEDKTQCSAAHLSHLLREHVEKGDPLDVGNLAMMLHQRGERIAAPPPDEADTEAAHAVAYIMLGRVNAPEQEIYRASRAAIAALRERGWRKVPPFPTEKMVQAGCDNITEQYRKSDWEDAKDMAEEFDCIRLFQAMLSAAPEPPA